MPGRPTQHAEYPGCAKGFSLLELLVVLAIILIITAVAVPNFMRSRIAANEAATVQNMRTITSAQVVYFATYNNGFAPGLANLGGSGAVNCSKAQLIDLPLSQGLKSGYVYSYTGVTPLRNPAPGCAAVGFFFYQLRADPLTPGITGQRHFYADSSGIIRQNQSGPAGPTDSPIG